MKVAGIVICYVVVCCSGFNRQFPDSLYSSSDSDPNFFPWLEYSDDEESTPPTEETSSSNQQQVRAIDHGEESPSLPPLDGNRTYFDLFLCGQFMDFAKTDDSGFAVVTFDYAGYKIQFDPCEAVDVSENTRPINFIYRSGDASGSADLKASQALPTMWRRFVQSNNGRPPSTVHFFSWKLPTKTTIKKLVNFVQQSDRVSVSFFLAYYQEETSGVRNLFQHIDPLLNHGIQVMHICGRCSYLANLRPDNYYRMISRYGMARPNTYVRDGCPLIHPLDVPGEIFNGVGCKTFQTSMIECASDFILKNCRLSRDVVQGRLVRIVYNVTSTCLTSTKCWEKETSAHLVVFKDLLQTVCKISTERTEMEVGQCAIKSADLPFDPNSSSTAAIHSASAAIIIAVTIMFNSFR